MTRCANALGAVMTASRLPEQLELIGMAAEVRG